MKATLLVVLAGSLVVSASVRAATFTVVNTNSTGGGSLAQAITDANASAGADTITFAITNLSLTIRPSSALPEIVEPVTIDGRSQTGFVGAPIVEISGGSAGAAVDGFKIATSNSVISALVINGFFGDGIEITNGANNVVEGCYIGLNRTGATDAGNTLNGVIITNSLANTIGGLGATNRNFISGNNQSGVAIGGALSASNSILGNVIGLNATNNAIANSVDGIRVNAPFTSIGGSTTAARNIISGNTGDGIESVAPLGTNLVVRGNWIGVDTNGVLDRGNTVNGILAAAGAAIIGGSGAGEGNLISGNNDDGIELNGVSSTNHLVLGNIIGSSSAFAANVINSGNGILITTSSRSNVIGGILAGEANTIYFNTGDGIGVAAANANTNNAFRGNLIFGSGASGIDLGAAGITTNDNGDADVGANQLQNFPVLTSVSNTTTDVYITGTLNSRPSTTYAIDFFSSIEADTALNGEGQFYIGSTNLATGADSNLAFTVSFPIVLQGRHVSATATDPSGNTSEFSAAAVSVSFAAGQTFTVVNTNDSGAGSLREAINQANLAATTGSDTIQFAIANLSTTISPSSELPALTDAVTIDGYTQPSAAVNTSATIFNGTVLVRIAGASAGSGANGITITTSNCIVRGLMITGFTGTGADGIEISGGGNNLIEGCLIGIDAAGTDQGHAANGVFISSSPNNIIGGTTPAARNVISGNASDGVEITGGTATGNQVLGNLLGTGLSGVTAVANSADGVLVNGSGATIIGGAVSGAGNLISGNGNDGVELTALATTNTIVLGNRIGTDVSGTVSVLNGVHGVNINTSSRSNVIGGVLAGQANTIAFNGQDGVNIAAVTANTNNTIRGNSIFSNGTATGELGIDLGAAGVTANDSGDPDVGANQLQNFPALAWVTNTVTETVISGSLNSKPSTTYAIDFYANTETDFDGFGEGRYHLGSTNLSTAADSNLTFTISLPVASLPGRYITATATDPFGNTSEFGAHVSAVSTVPGTTYTVVNTNDSGAGSLRQAILNANANISAGDTIDFAITNLATTISPSSALPSITDPVTIDGYTQSGAVVNTSATIFNGTVLVRIAGASAGSGANGLTIAIGNNTVRGLMITGFTGSTGDGIEITGAGGNVIEGCLLGVDAASTDQGNAGNGVLISGSANNIVGGTTPAARNVISGNQSDGIEISGVGAMGNQVLGNLLGTGLTGATAVVNTGDGVLVTGAGANVIGGSAAGAGNLISGNNNDGIELTGLATTNTIVLGNRIGTDAGGTVSVLNGVHGININTSSRSNVIGGVIVGEANTIAFNGQDGVNIAAATANTNNTIRGNSIFSNGTVSGELGIDLGAANVTANDLGDPDTGANQLQNFPVLAWVTNTATETTFSGSLNSRPSTTYAIDFYANTTADTDGVGEGQYYLSSTNLTTGADSNLVFTISLPVAPLPARYISATATDPFGNTSEFGTNVFAQSTAPGATFTVINTNDSGAGSLRQAILNANANVSAGDTIAFAITNLSLTISPSSALPTIIDPVTIDGSTQPGFVSAPIVELNGISAGASVDGLSLATSNSVIRSLAINRFRGDGIEISGGRANTIEGCYIGLGAEGLLRRGNGVYGVNIVNSPLNVIGGLSVSNRNYICGNTNAGVFITGTTAVSNRFFGNIIGLNSTNGIVLNGGGGMFSSSPFTIVGGSTPGARNVISGNTAWGINLAHPATNCVIQGNYIGTDTTGTLDLGSSGYGVTSGAGGTIVGGSGANEGNLISGNFQAAIEFNGISSTNNVVKGNILGADITGTLPLANNSGVSITGNSRSNIVGGVLAGEANLIAFNANEGISVAAAVSNTNNTFRGNSIFSNGSSLLALGIDLGTDGIASNDVGDADTGANALQNFPVLTGVTNSLSGTDVAGSLNSAANTTFILDFYSNPTPDTGGTGEGKTYLGSASITTDGTGNTNFLVTIAATNLVARHITATATDPFGNTSEFGTNIFAFSTLPGLNLVVTNTNDGGPGSLREAIAIANTNINAGDTITFNIAGAGVQVISPASALPTITDPVTIDGYSQPGASANTLTNDHNAVLLIRLNGASAGAGVDGLQVHTHYSLVKGLAIGGFTSDGIEISGGVNNFIEGCYLGLDPDGATRRGNTGNGVHILSSSNGNTVGGETPAARCIVSANHRGVFIVSSTFSTVKGSCIGTDAGGSLDRGNTNSGVYITGSTARFNVIGGTNAAARNVISGNGEGFTGEGHGITLSQCLSNSILGNYIGTTASGSVALGNVDEGISLNSGASTNFIGGSTPGAGNVISANSIGIDFSNNSPDQNGNVVEGNFIGTDATGMVDLGNNSHGISFSFADFNQIGGTAAGARNVISGNNGNGVNVNCCAAQSNVFEGNFIGVAANGTSPLGNGDTGVFNGSSGTRIGGTAAGAGNIIANNGDDGIIHFISSSFGVSILGNNIYSNGGLGIELGLDNAPTPNDPGDVDTGANGLQNFPVILQAAIHPTETLIEGSLNSISNRNYRIELFSSVVADSSGHGEGQVYLGVTNVTTDATGNATFSYIHPAALVSNHVVTATATATTNTSEFSAARRAAPHDTLDLTLLSFESANLVTTTTNFTYTLYVTNNGPTNSLTAVVTNILDPTVNFVFAVPSLGSVTNYGSTVVWQIGALTNNGTASVILSVNATMNGVVSNYASITSLEMENLPANNSDFETTTVGVADVGVLHVAMPNPVVAGTILTNVVTVTNRGPDTARSVTFSYIPATSMFAASASSSAGSVSIIGNSVSGNLGDIPASNIVTVTVLTIPTEVGVYSDSFGISHPDNDPVFANNNGNSSVTVNPGVGVFQFQQPTYAWGENVSAFAVGVIRTGGSTGTVAIDFSTQSGSATAGSDFVSTNGTLTFTNGETLKFFTVNMTDDPIAECNEVFNMSLGNPTGGAVAVLNTNATVEIFDNEVAPSGSIALASEANGSVTTGFGNSSRPSISFDGRYIAFQSDVSGLVTNLADPTFNNSDVFVFDFQTRQNSLVSVNSGGVSPGNSGSFEPIISRDGRHVIFHSDASDIVSGDNNSATDIFIRNLNSSTTELVTRAADGGFADQGTSYSVPRGSLLSSNGNIVVFSTGASNLATNDSNGPDEDVFARDVTAGVTRLVSVDPSGASSGDSNSTDPTVSGNGRYVAFTTFSTNLTAYTDINNSLDVFRRDLWSNITDLVSINLAGTDPGDEYSSQPLISHEGRFVTFHSLATTLVTNSSIVSQQVFQRDMDSGETVLVSVSTNGTGANYYCELIAATPDGRYVLFATQAGNLVTNDVNNALNIFVRDLVSGTTVGVNYDLNGDLSNVFSDARGISDDGRYVVFLSDDDGLVSGDMNGTQDAFVRDLQLGQTTLLSRGYSSVNSGNNASYEPVLSGGGSTTAFTSSASDITPHDVNNNQDVFARSLSNTSNVLASVSISETANEYSFHPVISADGTRLVFASYANNLTSNTGSVVTANIYLRNLTNGTLTLVSISTNGGLASDYCESPSISPDNRFVLFWSQADNLVPGDANGSGDFFLRDLLSNTTMLVGPNATNGNAASTGTYDGKMTPDAQFIVFESTANDIAGNHPSFFDNDIFIRNRTNATAELVTVNAAGTAAGNSDSYDPAVSDDGRYVAFETFATDMLFIADGNSEFDVVVRDRLGGSNILVSINSAATGPGNGGSHDPIISANGRFVVFQSDATDLVTGDTNNQTDIFIRDLVMNTTALVSVKSSGAGSGNGTAYSHSMTPDGRYVIFESAADDLVANDSNGSTDVFVRDTVAGTTTLISANCNGTGSGNNHSYFWDYDQQNITPDGRYVTFITDATDLAGGDYPGTDNIMRRDLLTGTIVMVTQNRFYTGSGVYGSWQPTISTNGSVIGFTSGASDLVENDLNGTDDAFAWTVASLVPQPDLVMDKTASTGAAVQFANLTYTLAVTNFGSASATSVSVADVLPVGMTFVSAITSQGTVTNSGGSITASIGTLAIGNGAAVSITVTASGSGSITNTASASSSVADATPANNTDSVVVTVTSLSPPVLSIQPTNSTQLLIAWPATTPSGFVLETTTNLVPVIVWTSVTNSVSISGTNKFVVLDVNANEPERYYRLKQ